MSFLWTRVDRSLLEPGDHIYCYRKCHFYTHHGIYIGDNRVIHLTRTEDDDDDDRKSSGSSSSFFSSSLSYNKNCKECNGRENNPTKSVGGVVKCCVDCFVKGRHGLHRFEYGVSSSHLKLSRAGTCSTSPARYTPEETVQRAKEALVLGPQAFGDYDLFNNNCEAFAVYCKTGDRVSLQALEAKNAFQDLTSKPFSLKSLGRTAFDLAFTKKFNALQNHVEAHRRGKDDRDEGPK